VPERSEGRVGARVSGDLFGSMPVMRQRRAQPRQPLIPGDLGSRQGCSPPCCAQPRLCRQSLVKAPRRLAALRVRPRLAAEPRHARHHVRRRPVVTAVKVVDPAGNG